MAEEGSERLSDETAGAELPSSVLLILEARRNLIRLAREGTLKPEQYKACMDRVEEDATTLPDRLLGHARSSLAIRVRQ